MKSPTNVMNECIKFKETVSRYCVKKNGMTICTYSTDQLNTQCLQLPPAQKNENTVIKKTIHKERRLPASLAQLLTSDCESCLHTHSGTDLEFELKSLKLITFKNASHD